MKNSWYAKVTSSHQGLVADEITGRTVALVYDDKDTDLISAAPDLLEALEWIVFHLEHRLGNRPDLITSNEKQRLTAAIAKAKGE